MYVTDCTQFPDALYDKLYRVLQEERTRLREGVPYVKLYRKTPKHLSPKFNGYGDIGQRKVWTSLVSAYCTLSVTSYSAYLRDGPCLLQLHSHVIARSSRATLVKLECIVVGSQWTTMTRVRVFL